MYMQINSSGTVCLGNNPTNFKAPEIREHIYNALNANDYSFSWKQKQSQPYQGTLSDGEHEIDVYIYAWNMTPAYRNNPSEKRIQIQAAVSDVGINRNITDNEKTIIIGLYNSPTGEPLYAAWDPAANRMHGQKSCYVQIEDVAKAITDGIYRVTDKNGFYIFTMTSDMLADYISQLKTGNQLDGIDATKTLKPQLKENDKPKRKKRILKSIEQLHNNIKSLSETEKITVHKARIGQGFFKDLLLNKFNCKCALCNITTRQLLVASHIVSWAESTDDQKLDENNGLLLCAHHDALFDKHLISFDDNGALVVSSALSVQECNDLQISTIPALKLTDDMKPYMAIHRSKLQT